MCWHEKNTVNFIAAVLVDIYTSIGYRHGDIKTFNFYDFFFLYMNQPLQVKLKFRSFLDCSPCFEAFIISDHAAAAAAAV